MARQPMRSRKLLVFGVAAARCGVILFVVLGRGRDDGGKARNRGPCAITVKRTGIFLDGRLVDSAGAAAYCRINGGSAEIEVEPDAPAPIVTEVERTFREAKVPATLNRR